MASNNSIEIEVNLRTTGKGPSRGLRKTQLVPAVVYGPKLGNMTMCLKINDAVRYSQLQFENTIFVLKSGDKRLNDVKVLKKSVDIHPVTRRPIHMDFYALDMTQTVRVNVELRFDGRAEGTKEGGIFNAVRRDVEIECLPTAIPNFISIDITNLQINQSLHVSDLQIPEGAKLITGQEETVATVNPPQAEEAAPIQVAADAAATAAAGAAAPGAAPAAPGATPAAAPAAGAAPAKDKKG